MEKYDRFIDEKGRLYIVLSVRHKSVNIEGPITSKQHELIQKVSPRIPYTSVYAFFAYEVVLLDVNNRIDRTVSIKQFEQWLEHGLFKPLYSILVPKDQQQT